MLYRILALTLTILFASPMTAPLNASQAEQATEETLTNQSIVDLHELGFGEDVVIEKIRNTNCAFDVDIDNLKSLKDAGVSSAIISEMINAASSTKNKRTKEDPNDPLSAHESGIYSYTTSQEQTTLKKIEPSRYNQKKTGGFMKSALTYGAVKAKSKGILTGTQARLVLDSEPIFYFYFDATESSLSTQGQGQMAGQSTYTNPGEFILAEFTVKKKKQHRELVLGRIGAWGSMETGATGDDIHPFDYEEVSDGIFKVTTREPLPDGEYCFYYAGTTTPIYGFWGGGDQVFDFSVRSR
ncbi:MAG: hypothetical protein AAF560_17795 [Acidobacteriota bacterium]